MKLYVCCFFSSVLSSNRFDWSQGFACTDFGTETFESVTRFGSIDEVLSVSKTGHIWTTRRVFVWTFASKETHSNVEYSIRAYAKFMYLYISYDQWCNQYSHLRSQSTLPRSDNWRSLESKNSSEVWNEIIPYELYFSSTRISMFVWHAIKIRKNIY